MKNVTNLWMLCMMTFCLWMQPVDAQNNQPRKNGMTWEKMQEMQMDFIAHSLLLSDKDTEKFKKVYLEYAHEMRQLMSSMGHPNHQQVKKADGENNAWKQPSDEEVERMLKARFAQSRKMLDLHEKYYDKYRKFLSPRQIQKIYDMEMMNMGRVQQEINRRNMMRGIGNGNQQQPQHNVLAPNR